MKAVVVYESLWGNTKEIARAIAEGIGPEASALSTSEATAEAVADADLLVAGAPLQAFNLPSERGRASIDPAKQKTPPDLSAPTLRSWLGTLRGGHGSAAAFETKIHWSPGSAVHAIERELERAGYTLADESHKFFVAGTEGPLKAGEVERARDWGRELATVVPGAAR